MKRGFLVLVIAFAIFSAFIFLFDLTQDCSSVPCIANYVSSGETRANEINVPTNPVVSTILKPFTNSNKGSLLLAPGDIIHPGHGWSGLIVPSPEAIGSHGVAGFNSEPVAAFTNIPFEDVLTTRNVEVTAYHYNGIDHVDFMVNGGSPVTVSEATLNPETGLVSYWATLDASDFGVNELAEVRAIVYPKTAGRVRVLQSQWSGNVPDVLYDSSMVFNMNPSSNDIRYVSNNGEDLSGCGININSPCKNIAYAINEFGVSDLGGDEIRLLEGTYVLPEYFGSSTTTSRWFTITSAENADPANVIIDGMEVYNGFGMYPIKQLKISNVELTNPIRSDGTLGQYNYVWLDNVNAYYTDPNAIQTGACLGPWTGDYKDGPEHVVRGYMTNSKITNSCDGAQGVLIKNVFADTTGTGSAIGNVIIDYTAKNVIGSLLPTGPNYASSIFPLREETIIIGGGTVDGGNIVGEGITDFSAASTISNIAVDGVYLNLGSVPNWAFTFCDNINHMTIMNSIFIGPSNWCSQTSSTANIPTINDVLIQDSLFFNGNPDYLPHDHQTDQLIPEPNVHYVTTSSVLPLAPTGLIANPELSSIQFSWTDTNDDETGYTLQYKLASDPDLPSSWTSIDIPSTSTTYVHNVLQNNLYNYRLFAYNPFGESTLSSNTVTTYLKPSITNINPNPVQNGAPQTLALTGINFVNNFGIEIRVADTDSITAGAQPGAPVLICVTGLLPGCNSINENSVNFDIDLTPYPAALYEIRMISVADSLSVSDYSPLTVQLPQLSAPTGLTVTPLSPTQLKLDWNDVVNEDNYELQRRQGTTGTFNTIATVSANQITYTDDNLGSGLTPNTLYQYQIRALGSSASPSDWSIIQSGTTFPPAPVITGLSTSSVRHNVDRIVTVTGTGLSQNFFFLFAPASNPGAVNVYCDFINSQNCQWISPTEFRFTVPQGSPSGDLIFGYINAEGFQISNPSQIFSILDTTCLDGLQTQSCASQVGGLSSGVCSLAVAQCLDGEFETCGFANYQASAVALGSTYEQGTESICTDGFDNNCNNEGDITGTSGNSHGDAGCAVQLNGINAQPSSVISGSSFTLSCNSNYASISSVQGFVDSNPCGPASWNGNQFSFNCVATGTPGSNAIARCDVNLAQSYRTGSAPTTNVPILAGTCSGYSDINSCQSNGCEWVDACNGGLSSGGPARCINPGSLSEDSYTCSVALCGATCDQLSLTNPDTTCNSVSCSYDLHSPNLISINGGSTFNLDFGADSFISLAGQYFFNSEVLVDGASISNPSIVNSNSITFSTNAEQFSVGTHTISVRNPASGLTSNPLNFVVEARPEITSIDPSIVINDQDHIASIRGFNFDPDAYITLNGVPFTLPGFVTYIDSTLIELLLPTGLAGEFLIGVTSGDGLHSSTSFPITSNYPLDYNIALNPDSVVVANGYSFDSTVTLTLTQYYMPKGEIIVSAPTTPEATISFIGGSTPDRCTPSGLTPTCTVTMHVEVGNINSQNIVIPITATGMSGSNSIIRQADLTLEGVVGTITDCTNSIQDAHETCVDAGGPICGPAGFLCGNGETCLINNDCSSGAICYNDVSQGTTTCQLDSDNDGVPDSLDDCPGTNTGSIVNLLGCPLPIATEYSSASTTDFMSVDLHSVNGLHLANVNGDIQYSETVSALKLISGFYQSLDIDTGVEISNNLISVDSTNYPELDKSATLTFKGLSYSQAPTVLVTTTSGTTVCADCHDVSYSAGVFTTQVTGFSTYSTAAPVCGDTYCSLDETCSSCSLDCGQCSNGNPSGNSGGSSGGGGGGGGSSGGSSGGTRVTLVACNDKKDNDGDGLIDLVDPGCFTPTDTSEIDEVTLVDDGQDDGNGIIPNVEKIFEIRVVFWLVLILLIGGIVGVSTIILRDIIGARKFNQIKKDIVPSREDQTTPPAGI
jgi:hypothetical protein